jgi:hypothetical protein
VRLPVTGLPSAMAAAGPQCEFRVTAEPVGHHPAVNVALSMAPLGGRARLPRALSRPPAVASGGRAAMICRPVAQGSEM